MRVKSMAFRKPARRKNADVYELEALEKAGNIGERLKKIITNAKKFAVGVLSEEKARVKEVAPVYLALEKITLTLWNILQGKNVKKTPLTIPI